MLYVLAALASSIIRQKKKTPDGAPELKNYTQYQPNPFLLVVVQKNVFVLNL